MRAWRAIDQFDGAAATTLIRSRIALSSPDTSAAVCATTPKSIVPLFTLAVATSAAVKLPTHATRRYALASDTLPELQFQAVSGAPRRQLGTLSQCFEQAAFVSDPFACDIERSAVIDRGSDHIETDSHVDAALETEPLDRAVALVVVHRDNQVEVAASSTEEERVGRQRALDIPAPLTQQLHR